MIAIILSRRDFRENDQIVSLYTLEKGKMEALARGVKKIISKNSACLEPFFLVEVEILPGREINHLIKVQPINSFKNIRADLNKILMAGYIMNLAERFLQNGERDERIFDLLKSWLEVLSQTKIASEVLIFSFILKFLHLLGLMPEMGKCVSCGRDEVSGFYFADGGAVCRDCAVNKKMGSREVVFMSRQEVRDLKALLRGAEGENIHGSAGIFKIIHRFAEYYSEQKLAYFSRI